MKRTLYFIISSLVVLVSCNQKDRFQPDRYFSTEEQATLINQCVRYAAKLPPASTHLTKFSSDFDAYYSKAQKLYDLRKCYPIENSSGSYYFLMTREARSIWPAREAIGGTFTIDEKNKLTDYTEVFRTWKMAEDSLNSRAFELFDLMVKGTDLTPYRSKYKGDRYIEFPDDRFHFDVKEKIWKDATMDSVNIFN
jgi:hypothetical protein